MDTFEIEKFYRLLTSSKMGRKIVYTDITGSTMDDARRLGHDVKEYPHGTVVMSERQTKARGARDHKWDSTNTGNIYISIILHLPPVCKTFEGSFDLEVAACLAVLQVVRNFGVTKVVPKWPNDLWVRGHKLAGFLVEDGRLNIPGTTDCLFILGIGINVNADVRRSSELQSIATSLVCERGGEYVDREKFLSEVCASLEQMLANRREDNFQIFLKENLFQEHSEISVSNNTSGKVYDGKFVTICKNWDVKFIDTQTGEVMRGSSEEYTIRPKVTNKVMVVFASIHDSSLASKMSKWLTAVIDTSKYVVCLVPESSITATDEWMKRCSLLVLVEDLCECDILSQKLNLYLKFGGSVMASGRAAVFLASFMHIGLKQAVLELSDNASVFHLHLQVETICSNTSQSSTASDATTVNDAVSNTPPVSNTCPESSTGSDIMTFPLPPQIILFPTNSVCYQFFENEQSLPYQVDSAIEKMCLENSFVTQSSLSDKPSMHETQIKAYLINIGDREKLLTVLVGSVKPGGRIALWGIDIAGMPDAESISVEDQKIMEEDKFQRDNFLLQVLENLLKS